MSTEIPAELFLPTIEELEERTARDLAAKWKARRRLGKKERAALKQKKETQKLKNSAEESRNLSSLFIKDDNQKLSTSAANTNTVNIARPTLRASLEKNNINGIVTNLLPQKSETKTGFVRKRGRPPKVKPL